MSHHKTDVPCDCGWLSGAINDPDSGIFFDSESNCISLGNPQGSRYTVYCCPFCGGRFPVHRSMWVPVVPDVERSRIEALVNGLDSADAVIASLGKPDYDELVSPDETRNIEYYALSEWFNVEFWVTPEGEVHRKLAIKPLSPRGTATQIDGSDE